MYSDFWWLKRTGVMLISVFILCARIAKKINTFSWDQVCKNNSLIQSESLPTKKPWEYYSFIGEENVFLEIPR